MRIIKFKRWKDPIFNGSEYSDEDANAPIAVTPVGFFSLKLHGELKNDLKFYIAHTNFDIGVQEKSFIENTPGINMLEIFTPYTFKFNVGLCFKIKSVIKELRKNLCGEEDQKLTTEQVLKIYSKEKELKDGGKPYIMYVLPNGETEVNIFGSKDELKKSLREYYEVQENIGGDVIYGT